MVLSLDSEFHGSWQYRIISYCFQQINSIKTFYSALKLITDLFCIQIWFLIIIKKILDLATYSKLSRFFPHFRSFFFKYMGSLFSGLILDWINFISNIYFKQLKKCNSNIVKMGWACRSERSIRQQLMLQCPATRKAKSLQFKLLNFLKFNFELKIKNACIWKKKTEVILMSLLYDYLKLFIQWG